MLGFQSCVPHRRLISLSENLINSDLSNPSLYHLKKEDILYLEIIPPKKLIQNLVPPENIRLTNNSSREINLIQLGYRIDQNGNINYPGIGLIRLVDLTLEEAEKKINEKIIDIQPEGTLKLRLLSWSISVLGEVSKPGWYPVEENRITIYEALALAGDLTAFADRNEILLIRDSQNQRIVEKIDLNNPGIFYYLMPHDLVYVTPLKQKWVSNPDPLQRILTYLSAVFSMAGLIAAFLN